MKKDTFVKGALISTICIILSKILGILYVIPFNSIIGKQGGALYGYAYNIYSVFLSLSTVGIPLAISKLVSEYGALGYINTCHRSYKLSIKITSILAVIFTIILVIFAPQFAILIKGDIQGGNSLADIAFVIRVSATALIFTVFLSNIRGYLQGQKYIKYTSISQVIEQFVRVIVIIFGSLLFIKLFGVKEAVGIAIFGATLGGIVAIIYMFIVHRKELIIKKEVKPKEEELQITNKDILKKIISYSIPLIIMSCIASLYIMVDMSTVIKCLVNLLHFNIEDAEYIMSCISTWGAKLNVIVTSISAGIGVSLLPNITSDYISGKSKEVKNKTTQTLSTLLIIIIPMVMGLSALSTPVWNVFYGYNELGMTVFKVSIFTALFCSLFNCVIIIMQSINRYKKIYLCLICGLITKLVLNIPLMVLFDRVGLNAYWGASISTILGYIVSLIICFIDMKHIISIKYREIIKPVIVAIFAAIIMYAVIFLLNNLIVIQSTSRLISIIEIIIYTIIGALIYGFILYKANILLPLIKTLKKEE